MLSKIKNLSVKEKVISLVATAILVVIFRNTFTALLGIGFIILFFISPIALAILWIMSNQKRRDQLSLRYEEAKSQLRQNPSDLIAREAMLKAGREYYASLRNGVLTIYDEQAIANDMNAITNG